MKKIPTLFNRDESRRYVTAEPNPACRWVFDGEGVATRKWDGTCAMVRAGRLYKRREVKPGKEAPADFELTEHDPNTGKSFGWVPVGDGPEDAAYREAWVWREETDGTYELVGPKVNGNPEGYGQHALIPHGFARPDVEPERTYDALRAWLTSHDWEGLVYHHPDGRMAKIKRRDFPREERAAQ